MAEDKPNAMETDAGDASKDTAAAPGAAGAPKSDASAAIATAGAAAAAPLDPESALKIVLRNARFHDGLARGLHECVKALDRREAHLCILATSCDEKAYTTLITALCAEHQIPLITVKDGNQLGEWCGLCKYNAENKAVKIVGCSCAVIKSWGEESDARQFILDQIKSSH